MDFALQDQDARKLKSSIWHEKKLNNKKKKWLMRPLTTSLSNGTQERSKSSMFLTDEFLPQLFSRSDDVFSEAVRTTVERSFGTLTCNRGSHHVVQDHLKLLDMHKVYEYSADPLSVLKSLSLIIKHLNNNALYLVAKNVMNDNVRFEKTRQRMEHNIRYHLRKLLLRSNRKDFLTLLEQLSQIFRNPSNFRTKHLILLTPLTPSLLKSISVVLEKLNKLPLQALIAMNRKLKGEKLVPQFPPLRTGYKKNVLIKLVRSRCKKMLLSLQEEAELPKPLAKALSVVNLSLKLQGSDDIVTSEFFPFSHEIEGLQNDVLKAIWSLSKVKLDKLLALQSSLDPSAKVSTKSFRRVLKKYLMIYLFECNEIDVPEAFLSTLTFINGSRNRAYMCSKEMIEDEGEGILEVSSRLKQIASNLIPDHEIDQEFASACFEGLGNDDGIDNDDFDMTEGFCDSYSGELQSQKRHGSFSNYEAEGIAESYFSQHAQGTRGKEPKLEQDVDVNAFQSYYEDLSDHHSQNALQGTENGSDITIQDICDETSLLAYKLIGRLLEEFLMVKGKDVDTATRCYFRVGLSTPKDIRDVEEVLDSSKEYTRGQILISVVDELMPSLPKSCVEKVKGLMGMS